MKFFARTFLFSFLLLSLSTSNAFAVELDSNSCPVVSSGASFTEKVDRTALVLGEKIEDRMLDHRFSTPEDLDYFNPKNLGESGKTPEEAAIQYLQDSENWEREAIRLAAQQEELEAGRLLQGNRASALQQKLNSLDSRLTYPRARLEGKISILQELAAEVNRCFPGTV